MSLFEVMVEETTVLTKKVYVEAEDAGEAEDLILEAIEDGRLRINEGSVEIIRQMEVAIGGVEQVSSSRQSKVKPHERFAG